MEFSPSNAMTVGMEMEFQILDRNSLDLTDRILSLMELYPNSSNIKPEFIQNTVEVTSGICTSLQELETQLKQMVADLLLNCHALGSTLCGAGTHPFSEQLAILTPFPRYLRMEEMSGIMAHNQITFSTHVHIGMVSGDEAIRVMRQLKAYLPLLIALSASSPFWRGYDTGFVSYRHRILAASRSYGIPPSFENWQSFCDFFDTTRQAGVFETINDIHWDIRPRPHLGTLEVRVMDSQPTVAEAVALAGLVRAIVCFMQTDPQASLSPALPQPQHWWIEKENCFQASHSGMSAYFINDGHRKNRKNRKMQDVFRNVLDAISTSVNKLEQSEYLRRLQNNVEAGLSVMRQREVYSGTGSMQEVVLSLVNEIEKEAGVIAQRNAG